MAAEGQHSSASQQPIPSSRLVLLHPIGLDGNCWDWLTLPTQSWHPTLPGHGSRLRARSGLRLEDMADELAGWTTGPIDVVGVSMGSMTAQHFALRHPGRVRSLVLACAGARVERELILERAQASERGPVGPIVETTLARWFTPNALESSPQSPAVEYARSSLSQIDPSAFADAWRAIADHDVTQQLAQIEAPTTCVAGSRDQSSPPAAVAAVADQIPRSRMLEIDAPHMPHLETPEQFTAAIMDHLRWVQDEIGPHEARSGPEPVPTGPKG